MSEISRREFVGKVGLTALAAGTVSAAGLLTACNSAGPSGSETSSNTPVNNTGSGNATGSSTGTGGKVLSPTTVPTAQTASNFNIVANPVTNVGDTYANLLTAIEGETGAEAKYRTYAEAARNEGFSRMERLFTCTADAERIHIGLELDLAKSINPDTQAPTAPVISAHQTDINLISGATGEIYETSDMYPAFIKVAIQEGNADAELVFTRAKLAEGYHAELYLDAYNGIDDNDDDKYYLCPVCGYIHKGEAFEACPICLTKKAAFESY
jgi:rubrerythrin